MKRLRKVNDCYVSRFDETDLEFFDKDCNHVRVLEERLMGTHDSVFAIVRGEGDNAKEVVEILPKGSKPLFIEDDEPFGHGAIVVYKPVNGDERMAIVKEDNGQFVRAFITAPRCNMAEDVREGDLVAGVAYIREALDADVEAMKTSLRIKGGDELVNRYFKPKREFKPFDKVLMRNKGVIPGKWFPSFFSHEEDGTYYDTSGVAFKECIPYEGNEELTMTDKEPL